MANRYPFHHSQVHQTTSSGKEHPIGRSGLWPQQKQLPLDDQLKKHEYLKQQQKLRLMASSSQSQAVSADAFIENLLGKKDIFRPKTSASVNTQTTVYRTPGAQVTPQVVPPRHASPSSSGDGGVPSWLRSGSPHLPPLYRQVWAQVGQPRGFADTSKIFPVLLTSGLSTDLLGCIWGLANQTVAGQLTEQEIYIVLLLVALAQNGCAFNNLSILSMIPQPLVPSLNLNVPPNSKMRREQLNLPVAPAQTVDDFTDFQSANPSGVQVQLGLQSESPSRVQGQANIYSVSPSRVQEPPNLQSVLPPAAPTAVVEQSSEPPHRVPSVLVVGGGRSVGSRLANHSLGAPRSHHLRQHQSRPQADLDFSDFQQAANPNMFPRCFVKPPSSKTFLLKESAIRSEETSHLPQMESPSFPKHDVFPDPGPSPKHEEDVKEGNLVIEKPVVETEKEDVNHATSVDFLTLSTDAVGDELMSVKEDKYSALRVLSLVNEGLGEQEQSLVISVADDFGDFLSADDEIIDLSLVQASPDTFWSTTAVAATPTFHLEEWGEFGSSRDTPKVQLPNTDNLAVALSDFNIQAKTEPQDSSKADGNINSGGTMEDISGGFQGLLGKIYNSDVDKKPNVKDTVVDNDGDDEFGEFVGSDTWTGDNQLSPKEVPLFYDSQSVSSLELPPLALSRHGSLPSLDLKVFHDPAPQGGEQHIPEWCRCIQSCMELLQAAVVTLTNVSSPDVLVEVLATRELVDYLQDLVEVHGVCERISGSYKALPSDPKLDLLLSNAKTAWDTLQPFYNQANVTVASRFTPAVEGSVCGVCLGGAIPPGGNTSQLEYGGRVYHSVCANLWVNCVDYSLPIISPSL